MLRPLLERSQASACVEPGESGAERPESVWVDPADVLAVTLDLAGSMKLDAHLQGRVSVLGENPKKARSESLKARALMDGDDASDEEHTGSTSDASAPSGCRTGEAAQELRTELLGRFNQLRSSVMRRMDEVQSGRSRIADAERFYADLTAKDLLVRRKPRGIAAVGRFGVESYLIVVLNCLDRIRGEARTLRQELAPGVAGLSSVAARIEAFDTLLEAARFRFTSRLYARIPLALEERFASELQEAVKALPEISGAEELADWYAAGGWVSEFHGLARRIIVAALEHEWAGLTGWVEAAIAAETGEQSA